MLLIPSRSSAELNVNEITAAPGVLFTGTGDTSFRDLAGWTLPALPAQPKPYVLRLLVSALQIGAAGYAVTFQVVRSDLPVATAATSANCWIDRLVYLSAAFAQISPHYEKRIPAGVALPALKLRYKGSANTNNAAAILAGADGVYGRLEQISR